MRAFSFIHAADLHLDSPFKGISETNDAISAALTDATFRAFNRIIDLCIEKQVSFLLISGDIYDGADRSLRAQLRFLDGLKKLSGAGIGSYIVHGNHDPLDGWSANLDWPESSNVFQGQSVGVFPVERDGEEIAQICGVSYHKREVKTNLAGKFPKKTDLRKDIFTIGMLHCNIGANTGHEPYSNCTLQDLADKGYDYWALGHIHTRAILNSVNPLIVYPGNLQGLNPKEVGPRGCYLVNVDSSGGVEAQFIETDSIRWFTEELPIDTFNAEQELISAIGDLLESIRERAGGRPALCRITLTGRGTLCPSVARKGFLDDILQESRDNEAGEERFVWIESIINNTSPEVDHESMLARDDFTGDLVKLFEEFYLDKNKAAELKEALDPLFSSPSGRKLLEPVDDDYLLFLARRAETICLDKLVGGEGS